MDTTLALPLKAVPAVPYAIDPHRPGDNTVPVVKALDSSATLPANKPFVVQVVTARLAGTAFPEQPGEILPEERTLRPYDVPMLPSDKVDPLEAENEDETVMDTSPTLAGDDTKAAAANSSLSTTMTEGESSEAPETLSGFGDDSDKDQSTQEASAT